MMDPYRTLGLAPGASEVEIKRAYRRLAKEFHPDAAGEAAIPRFLAIQAAYEALVGPLGRGRLGRAGASRREPWRADPDRARATRESWRARTRRGGGDAGAGSAAGDTTGRPPGGARRTRRPAGDTGPSASARPTGAPGSSDRSRSRRRATPGSTSYDGADQGPFDPEWSGASWYGATSGTYWTLNPREYADPRKHGPEYQARARRASGGPPEPEGGSLAGDEMPETETSAAGARSSFTPDGPGADGRDPGATRPTRATAASSEPSGPGTRTPGSATTGRPPRAPTTGRPTAAESGGGAVALLATAERARPGRVALALLGWPPIGFAAAALIGELTGCARFSASCEESFGILTWVAQLAILAILLALPRLAAWATVGTLALLAAAIPAVSIVGISGGGRDLEEASVLLIVILALAWLVGVVVAAVRLPADSPDRPSPAS